MEQRRYIIGHGLLEAIAAYLTTRPYREVAGMIRELERMEPAPPPVEESKAGPEPAHIKGYPA
ncbi:MAG: hypothetical protein HPY84_10685 [Syntrophobacteraceae bacterium]|nr:hypothetical protein [Syntrophobacteraceae bacterium]